MPPLNDLDFHSIVNYGESIGSGVACKVDSLKNADGLVLQSGITSLPDVAKHGILWLNLFPSWMWPTPRFENCDLLKQSRTPLLVLHGERDRLVPHNQSQRLFDCAGAKDKVLVKLPHCGHNDVGYYDAEIYQKATADFVARNCP